MENRNLSYPKPSWIHRNSRCWPACIFSPKLRRPCWFPWWKFKQVFPKGAGVLNDVLVPPVTNRNWVTSRQTGLSINYCGWRRGVFSLAKSYDARPFCSWTKAIFVRPLEFCVSEGVCGLAMKKGSRNIKLGWGAMLPVIFGKSTRIVLNHGSHIIVYIYVYVGKTLIWWIINDLSTPILISISSKNSV